MNWVSDALPVSRGPALTEAALSYAVLENYGFKVSPYLGIGFMGISAPKADITLSSAFKELNMTFLPFYTAGLCFDIKFGEKNPRYMPKTYCFLKIPYSYNHAGSEKNDKLMRGGMHCITLGFGLNYREVIGEY